MSYAVESSTLYKGLGSMRLPENLTIMDVADWYPQFVAAASESSTTLTLDASALTRLDSAGVQLLLALAKSLSLQGEHIQWSEVSDTLLSVARSLGATEPLNLSQYC